jgi:ribosomal silencing factor RsfS
MVATTERAEKILTIDVTGMREEADSAMATDGSARLQMAVRYQHRVEGHLILSNKRIGGRSLVPIGMKRKSFSDG